MKITHLKIMVSTIAIAMLFSCSTDDSDSSDSSSLQGAQSEYGEVGNEFDWTVGQFGINDSEMYVSELNNGVSTIVGSFTSTDDQLIDILEMMPTNIFPGDFTISGNTIEATVNTKITDEGAQIVFDDGNKLTLVKYDANVGDQYTATVGGVSLKNEVVQKSTEDDYFWGGMLIKVVTVKYTSHTPGVLYVEHAYNHNFGIVGLAIYFEDGSVKYAGIYS